ncbi:MAG: primosomal protein N', partial [Bdellovibrionales bacterium]|nr:primosomal protein N' [Bdellovibrionales bacterium]
MAVKAPLFKVFTYGSLRPLKRGQKVRVPFGGKRISSGVILDQDAKGSERSDIKSVLQVMDLPPLSEERLQWLEWLSGYYHYPLGLVMDLSFPFRLQKKSSSAKDAEIVNSESEDSNTSFIGKFKWQRQEDFSNKSVLPTADKEYKALLHAGQKKEGKNSVFQEGSDNSFSDGNFCLMEEQEQCVRSVLGKRGFQPHLLYGVTGSGKTEIYKALTEDFLSHGKQVLILLPEIFLTPQIVERFSGKFPDQVAVWHSDLTARQKTTAWFDLATQRKNILIGTRSALFCPLPRLGLIVVDEEHSPSFKQETRFQYHARDSAIMLARFSDIPILLGSATPSLDSWFQAQRGMYQIHYLKRRAFKQPLPEVHVVDLRKAPRKDKIFWLSEALYLKIKETLEKKKQAALFLNRRGQAGALICSHCGYVKYCKNCDIALSLHSSDYLL